MGNRKVVLLASVAIIVALVSVALYIVFTGSHTLNKRVYVLTGNNPTGSHPGITASIVLSHAPGIHPEEFMLAVTSDNPDVKIYYTIDGNEPQPGEDRFITRGENSIQVSGRLPESGAIRVEDRSGNWRDTIGSRRNPWCNYA